MKTGLLLSINLVMLLGQNPAIQAQKPPCIQCPGDTFGALAFSDDGSCVAISFYDFKKELRFLGAWEVHSLRPKFTIQENAVRGGWFADLAFSPDRKELAALGCDQDTNEVSLWDTVTGNCSVRKVHPRNTKPHYQGYQTRELLRKADGQWLVHDAALGRVTEALTGKVVHDYDKKHKTREHKVYGGIVAVRGIDGGDVILDAITGEVVAEHPEFKGLCNFLHYSMGGRTRSHWCGDITAERDGFLLSKRGSAKVLEIPFDTAAKQPDSTRLSPDGRWLAISFQYRSEELAAYLDGRLKPGQPLFPGKKAKYPPPAVLPDEYQLQQIFDTNTGKPVGKTLGGMYVYFSPDGKKIAVLSKDNHVYLADLDREPVREMSEKR